MEDYEQDLYQVEPEIIYALRLHIPSQTSRFDDQVHISCLNISIPYVSTIELSPYFSFEDETTVLAISGASGSGKTTTLNFLQNSGRKHDVIYAPCTNAEELRDGLLPATIERLLVRSLLDALIEHAYLWTLITKDLQQQAGIIFQRHRELFDNHFLQQLKRMSPQGGTAIQSARKYLRDSLQDHLRTASVGDLSTQRYRIGLLGDIFEQMNFARACFAIDNAPADFDYAAVQLFLNCYLPQHIYLRIAFQEPYVQPSTDTALSLQWNRDTIEELLKEIRRKEDQQWTPHLTPDVYTTFLNTMNVPRDLFTWLIALKESSSDPDKDVDLKQWEHLRALPKIIVGASTDKGILGYRLKQFRRKIRNFVSMNI